MLRQGTRAQVMHGTALKTTGGLRRNDLKYNKQGKIVSRLLSTKAKKEKRLERAGWTVRKGEFGAVQMKGGFELGTEVKQEYKDSPSKFKNKKVTPIPESLITKFQLEDNMWKVDKKYGHKVNWYGVRKILRQVLNSYGMGRTSIPDNLSTRSMVMWLGLTKDKYIEFLETDSVKRIINNNYEYIKLAQENFTQAGNNFNKIRGAKTQTKEDVELQTLWLLAAGMNINKNLFKINLPKSNLLNGRLLANRKSTPQKKSTSQRRKTSNTPKRRKTSNTPKRRKQKQNREVENGWGNVNV
tara:strand:- start:731 stop:1624 length:894 start_codon:yes stop_codon:yes gene_type:complete